MEAAPQAPSLDLPKPVPDLTAVRAGNQVHLNWNAPRENTDHLKLHGMVRLRVCRGPLESSSCDTVATILAVPGKPAQYTEVLPPVLTFGPVRAITYRIFGINKRGRTAGPSNDAMVLAGQAPPEVGNLSAQVVERGVVLRWQPVQDLAAGTDIEIDRKSAPLKPLAPLKPRNSSNGPPSKSTEPLQQTLRVKLIPVGAAHAVVTDPGIALDRSALFGREYTYTAIRVIQRRIDKQTLRLASSPSEPIQVTTRDTFPPAVPAGLVAVPVSEAMNNGQAEVDLSWSANTEPDLTQYRVYRRDIGQNGAMQRIVPSNAAATNAGMIVAPEFRDMHVQTGHTYAYAVTAVDASGNESPRSAEVSVTVPTS